MTSPGTASQWTAPQVTLATDCAALAGCAIGISGSTIRVFYQKNTDLKLYYTQSSDDGVTWSGETATNGATPYTLGNYVYGIACPDATNLWIAWAAYADPSADQLSTAACSTSRSTLSGSTWSAWTIEGPASPSTIGRIESLQGILVGSEYVFAAGAQERAGLSGLAAQLFTYTQSGGYTPWSQVRPQDNPNLGISLNHPAIHYDSPSATYYALVPIHDDGSQSGVAMWRHDFLTSTDLVSWQVYASFGGCFQYAAHAFQISGTTYVFDATSVYTHSGAPGPVDLSGDVLTLLIEEKPEKPAELTVVLSNINSQYSGLAGIQINTTLTLSLGYVVAGTPDLVQTHQFLVEAYEYESSPTIMTLTLHAKSYDKLLDYQSPRTVTYSGQTIAQLVTALCTLAGMPLAPLPTTPQFSQTVPCFLLTAGQTYRAALDHVAQIYGFTYHSNAQGQLVVKELQATDPDTWDYASEILANTYGFAADQPNHVRVVGYASSASGQALLAVPVFADAVDAQNILAVGKERYAHFVDRNLDTNAKCLIAANLAMAAGKREATAATITCALNPTHELADVITLTDSSLGLASQPLRIAELKWQIDTEQGTWTCDLACTGV